MDHRSVGPSRPAEPLWQRAWLDAYPCDVPSSIPYPRVPISTLMEMSAKRFPYRTACTVFGHSISFAKLSEQSHRLARSLAALGARPGRRVGMLLPNIPEYIAALQATWLTGATALQLSPLMVAEEVHKWLEATGCHIIFTLDLLAPLVLESLKRGPLEHVIVASLARRVGAWKGWLYRIERMRRNGPFRLRENGHVHHFDHFLRGSEVNPAPKLVAQGVIAVLCPTGGTAAQR